MDAQSLFRQAVAFHQSGKLAEAGRLYGEILEQEPKNSTARQLLALVRLQEGRDGDALAEIDAALAITPDAAEALATRGNILIKLGRWEDALGPFRSGDRAQSRAMPKRSTIAAIATSIWAVTKRRWRITHACWRFIPTMSPP